MRGNESVIKIKGVGEKSEKLLNKLGIYTVDDLLEFYPQKYDIYTPVQAVNTVKEGNVVVLQGNFCTRPKLAGRSNLKIVSAKFKDKTGTINVCWFNMAFLIKVIKMGTRYILRGKIASRNGMLELVQPKILTEKEYYNQIGKLQPVYHLTAGITNNFISKSVKNVLDKYEFESDFLPSAIRKEYDLVGRKNAVINLHFPENKESYFKARRRLVFDEFFLFSMALSYMKMYKKRTETQYVLLSGQKTEKLKRKLPFTLTEGQNRCLLEIEEDLKSGLVMNRLIQGDVGSGKTIVAMFALLSAVESGCQGALMAPTEVLANQHYEEFKRYLDELGVNIVLLTGSMTAKEKREIKKKIEDGDADIIIGTHTLIQEGVKYNKLALVITDEQHRFGVKQREIFSEKGTRPHVLVMSATPIPRTLAIILYGDLDISVIDVLPANRLPIKNCAVGTNYRTQSYNFIKKQVEMGHQAYIICPMVEESENSEAENVIDYAKTITSVMPENVNVQYLHGKMKPALKNDIMEKFSKGQIDILVSTTVVEVGINVPNATVMMIENAERFGMASLHQLRGRVGRGEAQSYCIFMAGNASKESMKRLKVMEESNDGFVIARKDMELRGPGDLFGIRQSGELYFSIGDIFQDSKELIDAKAAAEGFSGEDIKLLCKKYDSLREKVEKYIGEPLL